LSSGFAGLYKNFLGYKRDYRVLEYLVFGATQLLVHLLMAGFVWEECQGFRCFGSLLPELQAGQTYYMSF
jgi:hypothetical protein